MDTEIILWLAIIVVGVFSTMWICILQSARTALDAEVGRLRERVHKIEESNMAPAQVPTPENPPDEKIVYGKHHYLRRSSDSYDSSAPWRVVRIGSDWEGGFVSLADAIGMMDFVDQYVDKAGRIA